MKIKSKARAKQHPHNYQTKLFYTYSTLIFIILLILAVLIFTLFYRYNYEKAIDSQNQIAEKSSQQLDTLLSSMDKLANGLLFNQDFMNMIRDETAARTQYNENNKKILSMIVSLDAPLIEMCIRDSASSVLCRSGPAYSRAGHETPYLCPASPIPPVLRFRHFLLSDLSVRTGTSATDFLVAAVFRLF